MEEKRTVLWLEGHEDALTKLGLVLTGKAARSAPQVGVTQEKEKRTEERCTCSRMNLPSLYF